MINLDKVSKILAVVSATIALFGSAYSVYDKINYSNKTPYEIITWAPEFFEVSSGPAKGEFTVIVAREKHRNDCTVEDFLLQVRDSRYIMHLAVPSMARLSGPASNKIDKYGYTFTLQNPSKVNKGVAMLIAQIEYKCPEGTKVLSYPDHPNLAFTITSR